MLYDKDVYNFIKIEDLEGRRMFKKGEMEMKRGEGQGRQGGQTPHLMKYVNWRHSFESFIFLSKVRGQRLTTYFPEELPIFS